MPDDWNGEVAITEELDIVAVRQAVRDAARSMEFGVTDVTRIVTAASELARNVYNYAGSGDMRWRQVSSNGRRGIELCFDDRGPGIEDVDEALLEGFTSGKGLGMGLPGARRLMGELDIQSRVGQGTTVTVRKWLGRA